MPGTSDEVADLEQLRLAALNFYRALVGASRLAEEIDVLEDSARNLLVQVAHSTICPVADIGADSRQALSLPEAWTDAQVAMAQLAEKVLTAVRQLTEPRQTPEIASEPSEHEDVPQTQMAAALTALRLEDIALAETSES